VEAVLDSSDYPTGVAISKKRMAGLPLERHATHGAWNYTLTPGAFPAPQTRRLPANPAARPSAARPRWPSWPTRG
jgi:hypothetical protein